MIYSLICSRTSKGLSLGELIRAYCIIIICTYMHHIGSYLPHYIFILAYLDDLRDFPTKSLSLVFNFREAENLLFHVFIVSATFWTSINRRKNTWSVFHREKLWTPGFLSPDACYAILRNPRITIFARHNIIDSIVHHPFHNIIVLQRGDLTIKPYKYLISWSSLITHSGNKRSSNAIFNATGNADVGR